MDHDLVYSEGHTFKRLAFIGLLLMPVLVAGAIWVTPILVYVAVFGLVGVIVLFSMGIYSKITLTSETLAVGRDTLPINELDPTYTAATLKHAVDVPDGEPHVRQMGGAYDAPMGSQFVAIRLKRAHPDGSPLFILVSSFRPRAFITALNGELQRR